MSNAVLVFFVILGVLLMEKPKDGWFVQIGVPMFEAGCIYWIYRALFFVEGPEETIRRL